MKTVFETRTFEDPPFARFLFSNTKTAVLWLVVRLYVGWAWVNAGRHKIGADAWTGEESGSALTGFAKGALAKAAGEQPNVASWYAWFLENVVIPNASLWGHLIAYGEFLVGAGLILGAFTGIAAFSGIFMNLNFMLAGTVSPNPILFTLGISLVLAWKVAGYIGLDRFLLPALGTPWQRGSLFR